MTAEQEAREMIERMGTGYVVEVANLIAERDQLLAAIRAHRDARGDDRCWMDDVELYMTLPEGYTPPARDTTVELARCAQFIASRQNPATAYISPQRRIEELEATLSTVKARHTTLRAAFDALLIKEIEVYGGVPAQFGGLGKLNLALREAIASVLNEDQ